MKKPHFLTVVLLTSSFLSLFHFDSVRADQCTTVWVPDPPPSGSFKTVCSDDTEEEDPPDVECPPGTTVYEVYYLPTDGGLCEIRERLVNICTGEVIQDTHIAYGNCPGAPVESENPCETITVIGGGFYCATEWFVEAKVGFPPTYLDARPYPATLVRWPTAVRCGGLPPTSGTGTYGYVPYGGGTKENPKVGDWRKLRLTLTLQPAGPMFLTLPQIGQLALPDVGVTGKPVSIRWELPSHPEAGGSVQAGSIAGFGSLPSDMPLFVGSAQSPYRLFWTLTYEEYVKKCKPGPDLETGTFTCKTKNKLLENDGHWVYRWDNRSRGGEIIPSMVAGLPPNLAADLNGDGIPEAYWNHNVTIRRMDAGNRVDNPQWEASWNWGGAVYWAVREGQGQIGWP